MERAHSKSGLFLIEMVIVVLFLAAAGVICARVFAGSQTRSVEAEELSMAETLAGGAADVIRGSDFDEKVDLAAYYPDGTATEDGMVLYYDKNWDPCGFADHAYSMEIVLSEEERERVGKIRVTDRAEEEIYTLQAATHIRYKAGTGNGGDKDEEK